MLTWKEVIEFANYGNPSPPYKVEKTIQEWRDLLSVSEFSVTRKKQTERANSSKMCDLFESGEYECVCCGSTLFRSDGKYCSSSGWPAFNQPSTEVAIAYHRDQSNKMQRIEATCNTCDSHLGHVFPDGPAPSGLRYCINAKALKLVNH